MQKKMRDKGWMYNTVDGLRREMTDEEILQPYERALQYLGSNLIQLRADLPLRAHVDRDSDPLVTQTQVKRWTQGFKCVYGNLGTLIEKNYRAHIM